ncbi:MAG: threonylcarbamoyl-AMP synthase [Phycisphaerales bacterium]|nr:threonylcarbamoyl-AMP synthase [Phycisphaerales bacterium]
MTDPVPISDTDINDALRRLRSGGLVAFPTETVYGLGADALKPGAVNRVYELKQRPRTNPLIVHVSDAAAAADLVRGWPREAELLARAFWPGPLTIVLPRSERVPDIVTAGGPNVALRCPDHPVALALLRAYEGPLVGPSANPSGGLSPTTADHVREAFNPEDVFVLDGGPCRVGVESTVVLLDEAPRVLRPGVIGADEIARVLGVPVATGAQRKGERLHAPGQLETHYAPQSPASLYDTDQELARLLEQAPGHAVIITENPRRLPTPPDSLVQMPRDARAYASRLYAALRDADALEPSLIAIHRPAPMAGTSPEDMAIWAAVLDRLTRATS